MSDAVLRLEQVSFIRDGRAILDDVSLQVNAGEHWALIGRNGAGKSTLLSFAGAQKHPTRGQVHVLGHQLGRVEIRMLRESIGHVDPRHPLRSPLTVREVIITGATGTAELMQRWQPTDEQRDRVEYLISLLGLERIADARWPNLSQGERGRALIARALLPDPPLLLLDEPCTGLDVAAREQFLETVDHLHATHPELATVLVTHHFEELPESTTHAVLIKQGRVRAAGVAQQILTTDLVSDTFEHPIDIDYSGGRWHAHAVRRQFAAV